MTQGPGDHTELGAEQITECQRVIDILDLQDDETIRVHAQSLQAFPGTSFKLGVRHNWEST